MSVAPHFASPWAIPSALPSASPAARPCWTARAHLFAFLAVVAYTGQLWSLSSDAWPCGSTTTAINRSPETASATITTLSAVYFCGFGLRLSRPFGPWRDVAHVLRPEDGGHLRWEREDPDMTQQLHAKRRMLANELDEPPMLNRWHATTVHATSTCIRLSNDHCIAFELVMATCRHYLGVKARSSGGQFRTDNIQSRC
jgi:hypothetical protein